MNNFLQNAERTLAENRKDVIDKLMKFAVTDCILFWSPNPDLAKRQEEMWLPILIWARKIFDEPLAVTSGLDVMPENMTLGEKLRSFIDSLSNRELVVFYLAAIDMRSVLLAAAFVKGKINAEKAYQAVLIEEIWQAESWGKDALAEERRGSIYQELADLEAYLRETSV